MNQESFGSARKSSALAHLLFAMAPTQRAITLQSAVSCRPCRDLNASVAIGPVRAAFAEYREGSFKCSVPFRHLRLLLKPPVPIKSVLEFTRLSYARDVRDIDAALCELAQYLWTGANKLQLPAQLNLFENDESEGSGQKESPSVGDTVVNLHELVDLGRRFATIYADPPWPYANEASRGAAINHYPTMSLDAICSEPVAKLAEPNAHLHLWTTNAFLRESAQVMESWGFQFKSCLVWIKDEIGMGNYWRMSHEYLMLGVRGNLTFRDRSLPSWIRARRTIHSRKPGIVRSLIERVSPGPYLEMYGREELPNTAWTVYGNEVERQLF